ncbi:hypothetical protein [Pseudonocardia sp. D17]|uniref:hypothetical protein n=1 Tax=Pseudonocardia sp. D17 TaxID=882661 RepID=UPI0030D51FDB
MAEDRFGKLLAVAGAGPAGGTAAATIDQDHDAGDEPGQHQGDAREDRHGFPRRELV